MKALSIKYQVSSIKYRVSRAIDTRRKAHDTGFTMIELLMVMAILGVLATFALISYPSSQKRARDAQRQSDIKQYQNFLQIYASSNSGLYPRRADSVGKTIDVLCGDISLSSAECVLDPKNDQDVCGGSETCEYRYQSSNTCSPAGGPCAEKYVLWAALEGFPDATYWVVCSNGIVGQATSGIPTTDGVCPI